jgi:hypothetical protein
MVPKVNKKPKNRNVCFMAELSHSRATMFSLQPLPGQRPPVTRTASAAA